MSYVKDVNVSGTVSVAGSRTVIFELTDPLSSGGTQSLDPIATAGYSYATIELYANLGGTLTIEWLSTIGTTIKSTVFTYTSGDYFYQGVDILGPYIRLTYLNDVGSQTRYRFALAFQNDKPSAQVLLANGTLPTNAIAQVTKSVIAGINNDGTYSNANVTNDNALDVAIKDGVPLTAFGQVSVATNVPYIQGTGVYGFVPSNFRTFISGTGTAGAENRMFKVSTGATVFSYGTIQSFRTLNYKPGQGGLVQLTGVFESNVENSWQGVGLFSIADEFSFGYNGTTFGVWHRYNGQPEVRTVTVTGAAGGAENLTLTLNTVAYTIPLTAGTTAHNAYEIANWLEANQTNWAADQVGATVIISSLSDGAKSGTYTFSSGTATGSIAQNTAGVTKTSDHIAQSSWNGRAAAWLDPSRGNVYQIQFQYLGFGNIEFFIEDPQTSRFILVHTIRYANSNTTPSVSNPSLRAGLYAASIGSTTDLVVRSASIVASVQGSVEKIRNPRAYEHTQTVSSTFTNIFSIRNRRTYNYYTNQVEIEPVQITLANESSKNAEVEIRTTTDTGVEQNYQAVGTNLVTDYDTTSVTGITGTLIAAYTVSGGGSAVIDLTPLRIRVPAGLTICILGRVNSGAASPVTAALVWYEDV